ncbi:MAG: cation:proton antiporter [Bacteroidetes bacterium]|nr:cation:proton antiporter [Bacteroidota bacterium]MBL6944480.1 cation:proton antiporter [Bacteroidales bacterium]
MLELWTIDAIWISVAFALGMLAKKVNLPPLIGFLAGGFFLNFVGITEGGMALDIVADIGVMLLLFTIGLKLNVKSLLSKEIWLTTSVHMILSVLLFGSLVFIISWLGLYSITQMSLESSMLIGFALSFSSTVFAVKVLEDRGEMNSFHGRISIGILVLQDIIAVVFLSVSKGIAPTLWILGLPVYLFIIRWILIRILDVIDHGELLTLFGFFAAFVTGAIAFEIVGLKPDLGALIIGVLIGSHSRSKELVKQMLSFKDFFLIAFFLVIGMSGLPTLTSIYITLILILAIPAKGIMFMFILTKLNLRARTAWHSTLSLANYSEFGLITGAIGVKMGIIDNQWMIILAMSMSFSFLLASPLNAKSHRLFDKYKNILMKLNTKNIHPDDEPVNLGDARVVICGMGHVGRAAYHQLTSDFDGRVIAIDYDKDVVSRFSESNKNIAWGDSTDSNFWQFVKMPDVEFILLTMNDHASNLNTANALSNCKYRTFSIGAPAHHIDEITELKDAGVSFVYNYYSRAGVEFANSFLSFIKHRKEDKKLTSAT